jgi:hypothetical protein
MNFSDTQLRAYADSGAAPVSALAAELLALREAIRAHKNKSGHELCWINDRDLWHQVEPEAQYPHGTLPVREEFLGQCARYYESRLTGTPYAEPAAKQTLEPVTGVKKP